MPTSSTNITTVAIETLGCKLNQAESESMALQLIDRGYTIVSPSEPADVYILNTCTVTSTADRKSRYFLRLARRRNPNATVIAIGCYSDRAAEELKKLKCVDLILSNNDKENLPSIIELKRRHVTSGIYGSNVLRTRSMIKIQEGCGHYCTYCIVPYVRGRERSLPTDEIVDTVNSRTHMGFKEVVLTGTKIGSYKPSLETLIRRILDETSVQRIRLSSLQPGDISDGLLNLWNDARLCRHLHLPLQSGSDSTLKLMNRPYSIADYASAIDRIRNAIPKVSITTDIIVGFPGETEKEFNDSYGLCRHINFANIHVFSYSKRPGTAAAKMPAQIDEHVKKERSRKMLKLSRERVIQFGLQFSGEALPVLWETEVAPDVWDGLTDNYIHVMTRSTESLKNRIADAIMSDTYNRTFNCIETNLAP